MPKTLLPAGEPPPTGEDDDDSSRVVISHLPDCTLLHILSFLDTKSAVRTAALSKPWRNLWKEVAVLDRLSQLPDHILHRILCSLLDHDDIKAAGRTSVLSRRWTGLWKRRGADGLLRDLRASSFTSRSNLQSFLRASSSSIAGRIEEIGFTLDRPGLIDIQLFDTIMEYAAATAIQDRRRRRLQVLSLTSSSQHRFSLLAGAITVHSHQGSITILKLKGIKLNGYNFGGFAMLTTLELRRCLLEDSGGRRSEIYYDPFIDLPCLSDLKLIYCATRSDDYLRVTGPQLLKLEIVCDSSSPGGLRICGLVAPKLESLSLVGHVYDFWRLHYELDYLPCLDRANVRVDWTDLIDCRLNRTDGDLAEVNRLFVKLFLELLRGLACTTSLHLCFEDKRRNLERSPLVKLKPIIEDEVSRFFRLTDLKIQYPPEVIKDS